MKTLYLYLTRQMLATLGMTVFVFTLVLMLGNFIKEVLQLMIKREATLAVTLHAIGLLIPYALAFSLPIGMLTAALLVFGRLSAEQELTAARASGISLISLVAPVLVLSVFVSALCAWLNCEIAPSYRMAYKELLYHAGLSRPGNLLESNESTPLGNYSIYVGKVQSDGTNLENVIVSEYDRRGQQLQVIHATSGTLCTDLPHKKITLNLENEDGMYRFADGWKPIPYSRYGTHPIDVPAQAQKAVPLPDSDMTFRQLLEKRDQIERKLGEPAGPGKNKAEFLKTQTELQQTSVSMLTSVLVYLHRAASFSFACIGFTLVGIPLGIRGHRRETSVGVAIALVLMAIYYSFVILAQAWAEHADRAPYLIVWLPDFIFQAAGAVLLWRANRGL